MNRSAAIVCLALALPACGGSEEDGPATPAQSVGTDWDTHEEADYAAIPLGSTLYARAEATSGEMEPAAPPLAGTVPEGGLRDHQLVLNGAKCYEVVAVASDGVGDLDLQLFDPSNVLWLQDATDDATPVLGEAEPICPPEPGIYRLRVRAQRGAGDYALRVFQAPSI